MERSQGDRRGCGASAAGDRSRGRSTHTGGEPGPPSSRVRGAGPPAEPGHVSRRRRHRPGRKKGTRPAPRLPDASLPPRGGGAVAETRVAGLAGVAERRCLFRGLHPRDARRKRRRGRRPTPAPGVSGPAREKARTRGNK